MKKIFKPKLGATIYCIYRKDSIILNGVYALSNHSFIVDGFMNKEEGACEYYFQDYGKTWFINLEDAKSYIWSLYNKEKYKLVQSREDCWDIFKI